MAVGTAAGMVVGTVLGASIIPGDIHTIGAIPTIGDGVATGIGVLVTTHPGIGAGIILITTTPITTMGRMDMPV